MLILVGLEEHFADGLKISIIDSLDTLLLMGLDEFYERARGYLEEDLSYEKVVE